MALFRRQLARSNGLMNYRPDRHVLGTGVPVFNSTLRLGSLTGSPLQNHGMAVRSARADSGGKQKGQGKLAQPLEVKKLQEQVKRLKKSVSDRESELEEERLKNALLESLLKEAEERVKAERDRYARLRYLDMEQQQQSSTTGRNFVPERPPNEPTRVVPGARSLVASETPTPIIVASPLIVPGTSRSSKMSRNRFQTNRQFTPYVQTNQDHRVDSAWTGIGFRCVCTNVYSTEASLQYHVRKMTQEWKYRCSARGFGCGQYFFQQSHLEAHLRSSHKMQVTWC